MSDLCREPDGVTVCRFAQGPDACWDGIQRLAQQLGLRGDECPHYLIGLQNESYQPGQDGEPPKAA